MVARKKLWWFPGLLPGCPGFDQDRVNFHQNPGRDTAGWADPTWPTRAGYSIPCAVMLGSGWGELGSRNSLPAREHRGWWKFCVLLFWFVYSPYLYRCHYCALCFAVLLNCPYPDPPVSACFFPFSSVPQRGEGWPRGAFVAGRKQTITQEHPGFHQLL